MTWENSVHSQIKKRGYDWDQEFDVGCKITKTACHPNGTKLREKTPPLPLESFLLSRGLKLTKV